MISTFSAATCYNATLISRWIEHLRASSRYGDFWINFGTNPTELVTSLNCRYQLFLSVLISTIHYIYKQGILTAIYWKKNWMYSWNSGHQFYLDRPILVLSLRLWNYTTDDFHFVFQRYLEKLVFRRYMEKRLLSLSTIYFVGKYI